MAAWVVILDRANARSRMRILSTVAQAPFAVQLVRAQGAHVSGACGPASVESAKGAGVDPVFISAEKRSYGQSGKFDAVFDTLGTLGVGDGLSILNPNGVFINPTPRRAIRGMRSRRYKLAFAAMGVKHLSAIAKLAGEGTLRPTIGM